LAIDGSFRYVDFVELHSLFCAGLKCLIIGMKLNV